MLHKKKNLYCVEGDVVKVSLTNSDRVCLVDKKDWFAGGVSAYTWRLNIKRKGVANIVTNLPREDGKGYTSMPLSRLLFGGRELPSDQLVVFENGDPLDCRRQNLAVVGRAEHMRQTGFFDNRWSDEQRRHNAKRIEELEQRRALRKKHGLPAQGGLPKPLQVRNGKVTRQLKGVRLELPAELTDSVFVEFLLWLAKRYPLAKGARLELRLLREKAIAGTGVFSNACQGLAERRDEDHYRISVPIGKDPSDEGRKNWALTCVAHEYKHCLQWSVEGQVFGEGGAIDQEMERAAVRFSIIQANRFRGLPDDPYGDLAAIDEARAAMAAQG